MHFFFLFYLNIGEISIPHSFCRRKRYCFIKTIFIRIHLSFTIILMFRHRNRFPSYIPSFLPNTTIIPFTTILLDTDRIIIHLQILIKIIRILPLKIALIFSNNLSDQSILLYLFKRSYDSLNIIFKLVNYRLSLRLSLELILLVFFIVTAP